VISTDTTFTTPVTFDAGGVGVAPNSELVFSGAPYWNTSTGQLEGGRIGTPVIGTGGAVTGWNSPTQLVVALGSPSAPFVQSVNEVTFNPSSYGSGHTSISDGVTTFTTIIGSGQLNLTATTIPTPPPAGVLNLPVGTTGNPTATGSVRVFYTSTSVSGSILSFLGLSWDSTNSLPESSTIHDNGYVTGAQATYRDTADPAVGGALGLFQIYKTITAVGDIYGGAQVASHGPVGERGMVQLEGDWVWDNGVGESATLGFTFGFQHQMTYSNTAGEPFTDAWAFVNVPNVYNNGAGGFPIGGTSFNDPGDLDGAGWHRGFIDTPSYYNNDPVIYHTVGGTDSFGGNPALYEEVGGVYTAVASGGIIGPGTLALQLLQYSAQWRQDSATSTYQRIGYFAGDVLGVGPDAYAEAGFLVNNFGVVIGQFDGTGDVLAMGPINGANTTGLSQGNQVGPLNIGIFNNADSWFNGTIELFPVVSPALGAAWGTGGTPGPRSGGRQTFTAPLPLPALNIFPDHYLYDFSPGTGQTVPTFIEVGGVHQLDQNPYGLALGGTALSITPQFGDGSNAVTSLGLGTSINVSPTYEALLPGTTLSVGVQYGVYASPSVLNYYGVVDGGSIYNFVSRGQVGAGVTLDQVQHFTVQDIAGNAGLVPGSVTEQIGVDIPLLFSGATNIGVSNASTQVYPASWFALVGASPPTINTTPSSLPVGGTPGVASFNTAGGTFTLLGVTVTYTGISGSTLTGCTVASGSITPVPYDVIIVSSPQFVTSSSTSLALFASSYLPLKSAAAVTMTASIPTGQATDGQVIYVTNVGTHSIEWSPSNAYLSGGATSVTLASYEGISFMYSSLGTCWMQVGGGGGSSSSTWFNVMNYGAVGNATMAGTGHDDTAAIYAAQAAAVANGPGSTVYFPGGYRFGVSAPLVMDSSVTWVGDLGANASGDDIGQGNGSVIVALTTWSYANITSHITPPYDYQTATGGGNAMVYLSDNGSVSTDRVSIRNILLTGGVGNGSSTFCNLPTSGANYPCAGFMGFGAISAVQFENVGVYQVTGNAYTNQGTTGSVGQQDGWHFIHSIAQTCGGYGWYGDFLDSSWLDCHAQTCGTLAVLGTTGTPTADGFFIIGGNNLFVGTRADLNRHGFVFNAPSGFSSTNSLTNCHTQRNNGFGLYAKQNASTYTDWRTPLVLTNCTFEGDGVNSTAWNGGNPGSGSGGYSAGNYGAGYYIEGNQVVSLTNCGTMNYTNDVSAGCPTYSIAVPSTAGSPFVDVNGGTYNYATGFFQGKPNCSWSHVSVDTLGYNGFETFSDVGNAFIGDGDAPSGLVYLTGGGTINTALISKAITHGYTGIYLDPRYVWNVSGTLVIEGVSNFTIESRMTGSIGWSGNISYDTTGYINCGSTSADGVQIYAVNATPAYTQGIIFRGLAFVGTNAGAGTGSTQAVGTVHFAGGQRSCRMENCFVYNKASGAGSYGLLYDCSAGAGLGSTQYNSEDSCFSHCDIAGGWAAIGIDISNVAGNHANDTLWENITTAGGVYGINATGGGNHQFFNYYDRSGPSSAGVNNSGATLSFTGGEDDEPGTGPCHIVSGGITSIINRTVTCNSSGSADVAQVSGTGLLVFQGTGHFNKNSGGTPGIITIAGSGIVDMSDEHYDGTNVQISGSAGTLYLPRADAYTTGGPPDYSSVPYSGTVLGLQGQVASTTSGGILTPADNTRTLTWTPPDTIFCKIRISMWVRPTASGSFGAGWAVTPSVTYTNYATGAPLTYIPQLWDLTPAGSVTPVLAASTQTTYTSETVVQIDSSGSPVTLTWTPTAMGGTATGGSATTLVETGAGWTTNAFASYTLTMTSGTLAGATATVISNTATTLTFSSGALGGSPASGNTFTLYNTAGNPTYIAGMCIERIN
jgi:hypothetical protein